jgi:hypothetical protein
MLLQQVFFQQSTSFSITNCRETVASNFNRERVHRSSPPQSLRPLKMSSDEEATLPLESQLNEQTASKLSNYSYKVDISTSVVT